MARALLVPNGSPAGYQSFPITVDAGHSFSVAGVPAGPYFLQLDGPRVDRCRVAACPGGPGLVLAVATRLIELRTSTPDLREVTTARPDVELVTYDPGAGIPPSLDLTNLEPWLEGSFVEAVSSQASIGVFFFPAPAPAAGATSISGLRWDFHQGGLPDPAKKDVVFVYQRLLRNVGSGPTAATITGSNRYARLTDLAAAAPGAAPGTKDITLNDSPRTASISADLRSSQFAAMGKQVHPSAVPSAVLTFDVGVAAVPHSVQYPDMPANSQGMNLLDLESRTAAGVDVNYGPLDYGDFLDPLWKTYRTAGYFFDVSLPELDSPILASITTSVATSDATSPIVPVVGPPLAPTIEGRDAFTRQEGVGLQPTLSWSAPALGQPSSYVVTITDSRQPVVPGQVRRISATVYTGRSFKVPPGLLTAGGLYHATITAVMAPWDVLDRGPFQTGRPRHTADCVTGVFTP